MEELSSFDSTGAATFVLFDFLLLCAAGAGSSEDSEAELESSDSSEVLDFALLGSGVSSFNFLFFDSSSNLIWDLAFSFAICSALCRSYL